MKKNVLEIIQVVIAYVISTIYMVITILQNLIISIVG